MRTLKKSLSLILALVFVLGLCTVGSNAAFADKYSDAEDVTADYQDAIEVLTGLQIIEGYKDGTFGPGTNVTRAEAAAMIARMMLGRESADKLPVGEVKFSDVPETHWAVKYIAFCANKGIIVGMGNGTFCPNDNVTGTQLAAMLLRALGYDAMGEYQGKGWDINAVADALYYGVFNDSLVVDFNKEATREETALYIWNTLWINLVGYDVDLNYYKEKERWSDGKLVGLTFADDAFDLVEVGYDSKTDPGTYVVLANQATGEKYTVVGTYEKEYEDLKDKDGKVIGQQLVWEGWIPAFYLDYETPLDYIGHEVTVYLKDDGEPLTDEEEHIDYYKTYLLKDESDVIPVSMFTGKLDDFYRAAKALNKNNVYVNFGEVKTLLNWDYMQNDYVKWVMDLDDYTFYYTVNELKGQKSKMDYAPAGTWIVDHAGKILLVLNNDYRVAKVKEVDTDHDEVVLDIYNDDKDFYIDGPFPMKWYDVDLVTYDGIAKNDYVQVQPVGKLYYINQTTTKTVDITEITSDGETKATFNNRAFSKDSYGYGIPIVDSDHFLDVGIGDSVKFYVIEGPFGDSYFGLQIMEKAKTEGIVYINYVGEFIEHGEWDTIAKEEDKNADQAKLQTIIKVQGINQEGEEVVYKFTQKQWDKLTNKPAKGDIFEVRKQGNSYFFDNSERALKDVVELTNYWGSTAYLRSYYADGSDIYYVTNDTKVIYFEGEGADLEIEVVSKLASGYYNVYALTKKSGGNYKLNSVWVLDGNVKAPDDYPSEGYLYVSDTWDSKASLCWGYDTIAKKWIRIDRADADKYLYVDYDGAWMGGVIMAGYGSDKNGETQTKYPVYIDGEAQTAFVTGEDIFATYKTTDKETDSPKTAHVLKSGFYQYKDEDDDGVFELKPVKAEKAHYKWVLGVDKSGNWVQDGSIYGGKLYTYDSNAADLKGVTFKDISNDTTSGTRTNANAIELETIESMLAEGYQIIVDYMVTETEDGAVPVGVMYIIDIQTPTNERGSRMGNND